MTDEPKEEAGFQRERSLKGEAKRSLEMGAVDHGSRVR